MIWHPLPEVMTTISLVNVRHLIWASKTKEKETKYFPHSRTLQLCFLNSFQVYRPSSVNYCYHITCIFYPLVHIHIYLITEWLLPSHLPQFLCLPLPASDIHRSDLSFPLRIGRWFVLKCMTTTLLTCGSLVCSIVIYFYAFRNDHPTSLVTVCHHTNTRHYCLFPTLFVSYPGFICHWELMPLNAPHLFLSSPSLLSPLATTCFFLYL